MKNIYLVASMVLALACTSCGGDDGGLDQHLEDSYGDTQVGDSECVVINDNTAERGNLIGPGDQAYPLGLVLSTVCDVTHGITSLTISLIGYSSSTNVDFELTWASIQSVSLFDGDTEIGFISLPSADAVFEFDDLQITLDTPKFIDVSVVMVDDLEPRLGASFNITDLQTNTPQYGIAGMMSGSSIILITQSESVGDDDDGGESAPGSGGPAGWAQEGMAL